MGFDLSFKLTKRLTARQEDELIAAADQ